LEKAPSYFVRIPLPNSLASVSICSFYLYVGVAFPLAVNTAAVLLAVDVKRLGQVAAIRVVFPEVGIQELYTLFLSQFFADFAEQLMLLMGADEQGGGESTEVHLAGSFCSF